jgi:indolepyruvate ferredoxin oxidoreductase beta subunit
MLGAICGSATLPFAAEHYVEAIRAGGVEAVSSTQTFEAARRAAAGAEPAAAPSPNPAGPPAQPSFLPASLAERVRAQVPSTAQATAREGVRRVIDYQDQAYASLYLDRLAAVSALETPSSGSCALTESVARGLALWMSFEDTIRVADLKIRSARAKRVLDEVRPAPGQLVQVTEFMKPRVEEICATLPAGLGAWMLRSKVRRRWLSRFTGGRQVSTSSIGGFLQLYWLAGLRRWRRKTLRYGQEQMRINAWLDLIAWAAKRDYALAVEIADCQQLVKGYGETHERGSASFDAIMADVQGRAQPAASADRVRSLRTAALADDQGDALSKALAPA